MKRGLEWKVRERPVICRLICSWYRDLWIKGKDGKYLTVVVLRQFDDCVLLALKHINKLNKPKVSLHHRERVNVYLPTICEERGHHL